MNRMNATVVKCIGCKGLKRGGFQLAENLPSSFFFLIYFWLGGSSLLRVGFL